MHIFPGVQTGKRCADKFPGMSTLHSCARNPWIGDREEGACAQNITHANVWGVGVFVIHIGPRFEPTTIVVKDLSNSGNSTHTELETTSIYLCLHNLG